MKNIIYALAVVGLLSGCTSGSQSVKKDFSFENNSKTGLMVVSTRFKPNSNCLKPMNTLVLSYKGFGKESEAGLSNSILNVKNPMISYDFENPNGYFYVHEVQPGSYHFRGVHFMGGEGAPAMLSGFEFNIKANEVNYLGEVVVDIQGCGKNPGDTTAALTFSDRTERDKHLFSERIPNVTSEFVYQKVGP